MMDDDFITNLDILDVGADGLDDAGRVAATNVKIPGLTLLLPDRDDIDRNTARRPDIVEIDAGRHDGDQYLVGLEARYRDRLDLKRATRVSETILPDDLGKHPFRHLAEGR
jgi:hypothetical protein